MELSEEVESTLAAILKAESNIRRMTIKTEKQLTELTNRSWKRAARGSLAGSLVAYRKAGNSSRKAMSSFLKRLAAPLASPMTNPQKVITEGLVKRIYSRTLKLTQREARVQLSFSLRSTRTVKAIRRHHVFWVGDFYSEQLSRRIAGVTEDVILNQGLSFRAASAELGPVLGREFGLVPGGVTSFAPTIPAQYAGNPELYFRQLSSVAAQQGRTFSKIEGFQKGGVITYRLTNPNDDRTGQICFAPGSLVTLGSGGKLPIEDVTPGTEILTGHGFKRRVQAVSKRRVNEDWFVCNSFGHRFMITPEHEILTARGWVAAREITDADFVRVRRLRGSDTNASVQILQEEVLRSGVPISPQKKDLLVNDGLRTLRKGHREAQSGSPQRQLETLFIGMSQKGRKERFATGSALDSVQAVQQEIQVEARRGFIAKTKRTLFAKMCDIFSSTTVPALRRGIQRAEQALLFEGVLLPKYGGDLSGVGRRGDPEISRSAIRGGSTSGKWIRGFLDSWFDSLGGGWNILAHHKRAGHKPIKTGSHHSQRLDRCEDPRGRSKKGSDQSHYSYPDHGARWCTDASQVETDCLIGWIPLRLEPIKLALPCYNLEIEGDDPTYIVADVVVHNCQQMVGQTFTVETAGKHIDRFLDAKNPEQIRQIQPWISGPAIEEALDGADKGSGDATDRLIEAGAVLPPFHPLCRTEPVVLSFGP
ncbi:hypothetical protein LCGC14_0562840 [marine sediment metagenome]|uniref:Hint domain-containing protein n=1 Tax=marine sediment metagenome TaxID=412755 RepID=A0A0F9UUS3_9ZZZZ